MSQTVTGWTIHPKAAFSLQSADQIPASVGQVQFSRAGPDMTPEVEGLLEAAAKQRKYQRRRGFQLPEHDVRRFILTCLPLTSSPTRPSHLLDGFVVGQEYSCWNDLIGWSSHFRPCQYS